MRQTRRVVITGIGAITPIGNSLPAIESALRESLSGIRPISLFDVSDLPVRFAGQAEFNADEYLSPKEIRRNDRFIQMCLAASDEALKDSALPNERLKDAGVAIGVGLGGLYSIEEASKTLNQFGAKKVSPFLIPSILANLASGQVSIRYQTKGPNFSIASACASGAQAIGHAYREIQSGRSDLWIAGGAEAPITPLSIAGFSSARALSLRNDRPVLASRPFDRDRDGFVLGEGAACFILESLDSAINRNAKIYSEIIGFGMASDGYHVTEPDPNGEGAFSAMRDALKDAGIEPDSVDYINAHATSTPLGDKIEALAMRRVFGAKLDHTFVSSTKSLTGHACGAAGAIETAFCSLMIEKQFTAPAVNLENLEDGISLRSPGKEDSGHAPRVVMNNSFGFGGINTSLLLSRPEEL